MPNMARAKNTPTTQNRSDDITIDTIVQMIHKR